MAKDPAVLWYWNDWQGGTMTLTRHQKGCYMDLLAAQFNSGPLSLDQVKTVLGNDQASWTVIRSKFKKEVNHDGIEVFFNERMETEKLKRRAFSEKQKINGRKGGRKPSLNPKESLLENVNEDEKRKGGPGGNQPEPAVMFTIEHCLTVAMADPRWVKANKTSQKELSEFNRLLEKRGVYDKNPGDYKNHFANWKLSGKSDQALSAPEGKPGPSARELKGSNIINT